MYRDFKLNPEQLISSKHAHSAICCNGVNKTLTERLLATSSRMYKV